MEKGFAGAGYILSLLIVSFANGQTSSVTYLWITFIVSTEETNDKIDRLYCVCVCVVYGVWCVVCERAVRLGGNNYRYKVCNISIELEVFFADQEL